MLGDVLVLFGIPLFAGLGVLVVPAVRRQAYALGLVFAGAYIFAITIVHILPELFHDAEHPERIGLWVLAGFFMQVLLELFTGGIEHGHVHVSESHGRHHGTDRRPLWLLIALGIHAFLEGTIMVHPGDVHAHHAHNTNALLLGIVLHKVPAALALTSLLLVKTNPGKAVAYLLLFAAASPLGVIFSHYSYEGYLLGQTGGNILFALVCGNFLHISTTIFLESRPGHHFSLKKIVVALVGAALAVLVEFIF